MADDCDRVLEGIAPMIAIGLWNDPEEIEDMLDPAFWVVADKGGGLISVLVERLEAIGRLSGMVAVGGAGHRRSPPEDRPILVVVADRRRDPEQIATYWLTDPILEPDSWPWKGPPDGGEG